MEPVPDLPVTAAALYPLLQYGLIAWLSILGGLVAVRTLRGDINTSGLLSGGGTGTDPERVTLLVLTLAAAFYYLVTTLGTPLEELRVQDTNRYSLPEIPEEILILLTGSQSLYISGKIIRK